MGDTERSQDRAIELDGDSMTIEDLVRVGYQNYNVKVAEHAWERVKQSRKVIDDIITSGKVVYGINTGFGNFADVHISVEKIEELQLNLIRSHCAGVGQPLTPARTRMLMALRINILCKGCSGISPITLGQYVDALNLNCIPYVPEKGTVGASGDLAPLSHLALGLLGEGLMWVPFSNPPVYESAIKILTQNNLKPIHLKAKEGLALINGTQLITALGAEALYRAATVACTADIVSAMTVEAQMGTVAAFDSRVHAVRPHTGQQAVAKRIRALLHAPNHISLIAEGHRNCGKVGTGVRMWVQDSYTLRCTPQVHGIVHDTIDFVARVLTTEMNSATDNPMVFTDPPCTISGGNFHGEYPAKVLDYLAIAIHEIANISERRIERLVNGHLSGLPPFLSKEGGLNSGFMIAHCTAAAVTSENKTLCHPGSIDSISTSAAKEDHVSMGGWVARKALQVVENVETVVAIELLAVCQAFDLLRPLTSTDVLEQVYACVRCKVPMLERDRYMATDIQLAIGLIRSGEVYEATVPYLREEGVQGVTGTHAEHANLLPASL